MTTHLTDEQIRARMARQSGGGMTTFQLPQGHEDVDHYQADTDWRRHAACRGMGADTFFPSRGENVDVNAAKAICAHCTVAQECLDYALDTCQRFGIWGGASERERRRMRRQLIGANPNSASTLRATRNRQRILDAINGDAKTAVEIAAAVGISRETVGFHLAALRNAGQARVAITGTGRTGNYWTATEPSQASA